ncbi:YafY family transcriptional regulator [Paracoccus gahaiensis]|uniref:YafY family transcriptional regulator n=1 Tax=Paracoccus gahaiensis TaxID=1706839 RepID=A0A4U0RN54_9RHOB|nr:YafY family protein [Paracoccus gahaiensis]TJZ89534.1 YafY family transcriptional regulator [Paracoccus gahaiensis]
MARQDRLMRLMTVLRRLPAPVTAARLAEETEISRRQLYRDIATLRAGGALIDGAAGVGYALTEDPVLPPQSFSRLEIEALMLAIGSLRHLGDATLERAGRDAVARIIATLPDRQARQAMHSVMRTWRPTDMRPEVAIDMDLLRQACWEETSLWIRYRDLRNQMTEREVWPLAMSYSPEALLLLGLCQMRQDYRFFHVARIEALRPGGTSFRPRRVELLRGFRTRRSDETADQPADKETPCPREPGSSSSS